jgi:hypothetical protein
MNEVKVLDRTTPANLIEIWAPRYRDKVVLIAKHKVGTHNDIVFTKAPSMGSNHYYLSGEEIRSCATDTNGSIACYAVPMSKLRLLERK